ncbi:archaemetzincin [Luteolibacter sp. Populi]|uniref:archaemetzincin n=1 Tax=Luteolibacter sp. Populi TaxID=3230487 RepID=UPI0034668668
MNFSFRLSLPLALLSCGAAYAVFTTPTKQGLEQAVGPLSGLDAKTRRAFTDAGEFQAKKYPGVLDWLTQHEEKGQTYGQYLASRANLPDASRRKLYILPIGTFEKGLAPDLELLRSYTAAFYHPLEVVLLPAVPDKEVPAQERINTMSAKKQWKSTDILGWLPKKLPADGYAMLAVTMTDLYPDENWNFVFGQASLRRRVGVFSFARYHPGWAGEKPGAATGTLVLRRAAKVLTHEMGHMFGIQHCIHYECNMNGANHLDEADATPMELCPVCLRKLHHAIRFDPVTRYEKLQRFHEANGLEAESQWIKTRLTAIKAAK